MGTPLECPEGAQKLSDINQEDGPHHVRSFIRCGKVLDAR
jgi:hypothetical protein